MWFADWYLTLKAVHIIFVIYWMAGLFMLPRYFAYHSECEAGSEEDAKWQDREMKILRIILMPSMVMSWILGLTLAWGLGALGSVWFLGKLTLVGGLTIFQFFLARWRVEFLEIEGRRTSRFFRMVNEIPGVTIIAIVLLVVLKPFG